MLKASFILSIWEISHLHTFGSVLIYFVSVSICFVFHEMKAFCEYKIKYKKFDKTSLWSLFTPQLWMKPVKGCKSICCRFLSDPNR